MSFMQRIRLVVKAEANNLLDRAIDLNSIPVLKQYIRDLEDAIGKTQHEAAVASASVTTLNRQKTGLDYAINHDKAVASTYLNKGDEASARSVALRIHNQQEQSDSFAEQITAAKEQSKQLDSVVEKLNTKHSEIMSRLHILENKDRSAKALEGATASLKSAGALVSDNLNNSLDNISQKIEARNDVAQEEFNRAMGTLDTPPDPTKEAAVDDILNSLRQTKAAGQ